MEPDVEFIGALQNSVFWLVTGKEGKTATETGCCNQGCAYGRLKPSLRSVQNKSALHTAARCM